VTEHVVKVRVYAVDVACDACGAHLDDIPADLGTIWAKAHAEPVFTAIVSNLGSRRRGGAGRDVDELRRLGVWVPEQRDGQRAVE
jgi:hypothetical protein